MQRPMSLVLRTYTDQDFRAVFQVYQQCGDFLSLGPVPQATPQMVMTDIREARQEGGSIRLVESETGIVGIVIYTVPFNHDCRLAYLELLMIAKPFRRQGLGAEVVRQVEAEMMARSPGLEQICSAVQVNNPQAIRFWQKQGYEISGPAELQADGTITYPLFKTVALPMVSDKS